VLILQVSLEIAVAVIEQAREEKNVDSRFYAMDHQDIIDYVRPRMYSPEYPTLVYRPPGIGE
jgi:hypothetical protein